MKLLRAAAEIAGGNQALARRLGISEALLSKFLNDCRELPDALLLGAVDIILADRQHRLPMDGQAAAPSLGSSLYDQ